MLCRKVLLSLAHCNMVDNDNNSRKDLGNQRHTELTHSAQCSVNEVVKETWGKVFSCTDALLVPNPNPRINTLHV